MSENLCVNQPKKSSPAVIILFVFACVAILYSLFGFITMTQGYLKSLVDFDSLLGPGFAIYLIFCLFLGCLPGGAVALILSSIGLSITVKRRDLMTLNFFVTFLVLYCLVLLISTTIFGFSLIYTYHFTAYPY